MSWREIINLRFTDDWALDLTLGPIAIGAGLLFLAVLTLLSLGSLRRSLRRFDVVKADLSLGNIGKVELRPNHDVVHLAHSVWVELVTRKAAIPFDTDNDVIAEVYNSWYELFREIRQLIRASPIRNKDAEGAIALTVDVLNKGLRPHLTRWQARFRRWYSKALESHENEALSPQEIQRQYPQYDDLVADLQKVSEGLAEYAKLLRRIAGGEPA